MTRDPTRSFPAEETMLHSNWLIPPHYGGVRGGLHYMAVSYKLMQNGNESSTYFGKYYAKAVMTDECTLTMLSDRIQRNCSMKKSDVLAVLTEMVEVMKDELQASHKVTIDGLGSFKIGIKGTYADSADDYSAAKNVTGYKVNFMPTFTTVTSGSYTDAKGKVHVKKTKITDLTNGISVQEY